MSNNNQNKVKGRLMSDNWGKTTFVPDSFGEWTLIEHEQPSKKPSRWQRFKSWFGMLIAKLQ